MARALLVASGASFFVGGRFLGGSVELAEELSGSSMSSEVLQKTLMLVGNSSRNRWTVMLGLVV